MRKSTMMLLAVAAALVAAQRADAQATATTSATRLITVGTAGGPTPRAGRAQSANLLMVNGTPYLIDAGDGTTRRLAKMRFNFRTLGSIFITHGHNDHTGGLGMLLSAEWTALRSAPIQVYGPPGTEALVKATIGYFGLDAEIRISDGSRTVPIEQVFFGHDVGTGLVYQDANIKVTAVENTHFHHHPGSPAYGKHKSYSYRFETPDRVIVFTGDTGASDAVTALAKDADILVTEVVSVDDVKEVAVRQGRWQAMSEREQAEFIRHMEEEHLTPAQIGMMAARAGVKTVVLSHLTPRPGSDDYAPWADAVRQHFSGKVLVAKDLMEF